MQTDGLTNRSLYTRREHFYGDIMSPVTIKPTEVLKKGARYFARL